MTRRILACALLVLGNVSTANSQGPSLPIKYSGPPTSAAIRAGDLMTRLYQFADDSMMGRMVGTEYNLKGATYIERDLRRLGLKPGGENGTFFQDIPVMLRALDTAATTLSVDGKSFKAGVDFLVRATGAVQAMTNVPVVVWGSVYDTIGNPTPEQYKGKFVVVRSSAPPPGLSMATFRPTAGYQRFLAMQASTEAAGVLSVAPGDLTANQVRGVVAPTGPMRTFPERRPINLIVTPTVAMAILGTPVGDAAVGSTGKTVSIDARFNDARKPGRNVIAIVPGSDPKLGGQYVLIDAHNDHVGFSNRLVDHDSLKIFNQYFVPQGADTRNTLELVKDSANWVKVNAAIDSLRKLRPARPDSIFNGADDDGSGSVALMEIAEAYAAGTINPKRSILMIWHAGEEAGMWGSDHFARNPTVPRDSMVAQLNIDMVGRGGPDDITGQAKEGALVKGDVKYTQLVGSRRLSMELGDLIETVNKGSNFGFRLDYALDANGHPQNIYCRSDHASYAAFGIPVVFFTTGGHADYHKVTDEPQYIRYDHLANLTQLIFDASLQVANLDHRVKVDKAGPFNPNASCQQ